MSEPTVTRDGHDKIIRFNKPIQAGGCLVRTVRIHNHYIHQRRNNHDTLCAGRYL